MAHAYGGGNLYSRAYQNAQSFQAAMSESNHSIRGGNVRVNLAKHTQTSPVPLDMAYIEELFRFYDNDDILRRTEELLTNHIYQQRPQFHANDVHLQLSKDFLKIVDEEYMRFSKEAHACIRVMGLVPMQYVILASGFVVPRVVPRGTYKISVYYDFTAEAQCYRVHRIIGDSNKSKGIGGLASSASSHVNTYNASNLRILEQEFVRDPRETASVRIDMGTKFPKDDGHDATIIVLDHFGYRPTHTGELRSLVHSLYPLHKQVQQMKRMYIEGQRRIMREEPYIESSDASEEQQNLMMGSSVYDNPGDNAARKVGDRYVHQQYDTRRIAALQRQQRMKKLYGDVQDHKEDAESYISRFDNGFTSQTLNHLAKYDASAPIFDQATRRRGYGHPLLSGERVANFRLNQIDSSHLPFFIERYEASVASVLGVPQAFFELNRGTQENIALHIRTFFKTQHAQFKMLGGLLTDVYNQIYAPSEGSWYAHVYFDRFLRKEIIKDMAKDYKLYYKALKHADPHLFALIKRQSEDIEDLVIHQFESRTGKKIPPRSTYIMSKKDRNSKKKIKRKRENGDDVEPKQKILNSERDIPYTKMLAEDQPLESETFITPEEKSWDKKYRAPQVAVTAQGIIDPTKVTKDPLAAFDALKPSKSPDNGSATLEAMQKIDRINKQHTAEKTYEDAMLNEEIRALVFLATLQKQQTDTIFNIFTMAGSSNAAVLDRMFENFLKIQPNMRVTISFASNANMDLVDLLVRGSLGFMTEKEIYDIVRTQASMPIDADTWTGSQNLRYVMKAVRENVVDDITAALQLGKRRGAPTSDSDADSSSSQPSKRQKKSEETSKTTSSEVNDRTSSGTAQKVLQKADSKKGTKTAK